MEQEIWKDIAGYEGKYQVSNWGRVMSLNYLRSGKPGLLKQGIGTTGYYYLAFSVKGKRTTFKVHRLVAKAFIPNPENKRTVNHLNGDILNNHLSNLEWATHGENHKHAYDFLGRKNHHKGQFGALASKSKPVNQYTKEGEFIKQWESMRDVERNIGTPQSTISMCCHGHRKSTGGFIWKFPEPDQG